MKRLLTLLIAAAPLAACTVGPNYAQPNAAGSQTGAFAAASPAVAAPAQPPGQWWRLYSDPALDRLVQQALSENTDLQVAVANLGQARALLSQARAGQFPSTNLSAGDTYGRNAQAAAASARRINGSTARPSTSPTRWICSARCAARWRRPRPTPPPPKPPVTPCA